MSSIDNIEACGSSCGCAPKENKYWQDVENKVLEPQELSQEFKADEFDSFSVTKTRRNFLKIMGFSFTALPMTGCIKIPVRKALPYLKKNENLTPGVPNWYATTYRGTPLLVKTREGRPIKIEGNDKSIVTFGGADATDQASLMSLYDSNRYKNAMIDGKDVEWADFDSKLTSALTEADGSVYVVSESLDSPSMLKALAQFKSKYNAKHVGYDAVSKSAFAQANKLTHGSYNTSEYDLLNADVILSFEADFMSTFGNGVAQSRDYAMRRKIGGGNKFSKHYQIESFMTMTGSNADLRYTRSHKEQLNILVEIYNQIVGGAQAVTLREEDKKIVSQLIKELKSAKGRSVIMSATADVDTQVVVNKINEALGNYDSTIKISRGNSFVSNDLDFSLFMNDMMAGKVGAVVFMDVNPSYSHPQAKVFTEALAKVKTKVAMTLSPNETSVLCNYIAPVNHEYESWGDVRVSSKEVAFTQPVIQPVFATRQMGESLLVLSGDKTLYADFVKSNWSSLGVTGFNKALHDGVIKNDLTFASSVGYNAKKAIANIAGFKPATMNVVTYQKSGIKDGRYANNPLLQEMPDPITKATWDNYIMVSPMYAKNNDIKTGDVLILKANQAQVELPAIVQPGVEKTTFAVALGYGRKVAGKVAKNLGENAYGFLSVDGTVLSNKPVEANIVKTDKKKPLAQTQTHHSMEGRDIVRETTLDEIVKNPKAGNEKKAKLVNIYPERDKSGHQWAMAIDLNSCNGCSACIVSCNTENNVSVVGRQEVANRREMHWLRLDRYYAGDENQPETVHMPLTCMHCENAPCENVCPVMAIAHSSDGINQQVYNRCVGTRYCANNCPYKVRRFNWFNYPHDDELEKMALNPDVSVRSRGIMEKCSLCIQRIQDAKLTAKRERRPLKDGDIKVACQQSCPTDGIIFGDMNDEKSKISQFLKNDRNYTVLEELNVRPRVSYLTKVRNK